nr:calmodulin-binding protein [Tanacetum cinerariifolium]
MASRAITKDKKPTSSTLPMRKPVTETTSTQQKKTTSPLSTKKTTSLPNETKKLVPNSKQKDNQNTMINEKDIEKIQHEDDTDVEREDGGETVNSEESPVALLEDDHDTPMSRDGFEITSQRHEIGDEEETRDLQDQSQIESDQESAHISETEHKSELQLELEPDMDRELEQEPIHEVEDKLGDTLEQEPKLELESELNPKLEHNPEQNLESNLESNPNIEHKLELELDFTPQIKGELESELEPNLDMKDKREPKLMLTHEIKHTPEPLLEPEPQSKAQMNYKQEPKLEPMLNNKAEVEHNPEPKLEPELNLKPEPKQKPKIALIASRFLEMAQEQKEPKTKEEPLETKKVKDEVLEEKKDTKKPAKETDSTANIVATSSQIEASLENKAKVAKDKDAAASIVAASSLVGVGLEKQDNTAYNNVIEETVNKLRQKRKNKHLSFANRMYDYETSSILVYEVGEKCGRIGKWKREFKIVLFNNQNGGHRIRFKLRMKSIWDSNPLHISPIGLAGYYRRFIQDFSKIASSLAKLTRKNTSFVWGKEQKEAFVTLRNKLCEAPILLLPEGIEDMVVYSDASYADLGCVLMQCGKVIAYDTHKSKYSIHPGATKMYRDLKRNYWWPSVKRDCAKCVEKCLTCLKVKAGHQKPYGKFQPLEIPVWKWEKIKMNFVTKLARTTKKRDAIWVIVDRLTKSSYFIPIRENIPFHKLAKIYVNEIIARHGVPVSIVSDRDGRFNSNFWRDFQEGLEFAYNNSYHSSIKMPPYEMLYGRRCRTPVCWDEVESRELASTDVVLATTEKIETIQERLKRHKIDRRAMPTIGGGR